MITGNTNPANPRYFQLPWVASCFAAGLIGFLLLTCLYSFSASDAVIIGFLITFILFWSTIAYRLVEQKANLLLSPMPWLLLASSIYFGFGPLIVFFGNEKSKTYCHAIWNVDLSDLWKVTLIHTVALILVFGVWWRQTRFMVYVKQQPYSYHAIRKAIFTLYLIGLPIRCITVLSDCDALPFIAPGFLAWLAVFTSAGLMLVTATTLRYGGSWWWLWCSLLGLEILGAMATFSKMSIILALIPVVFGAYLYRPRASMLLYIPIFLGVFYWIGDMFVSYSRGQLTSTEVMTMRARMDTAHSFFRAEHDKQVSDDPQMWWARFYYSNAQVFAIQEYDAGRPGDSLMLALIAPIPRLLWHDKPAIESGYDFYRRLTGSNTSSFGIGFFVEAYWNGGWLAVILCSIMLGWLLGAVTVSLAAQQAVGNLWALPLAFLWIRIGSRVDGWVHTEIAGPAIFTLLFLGLIRGFSVVPSETIRFERLQYIGRSRARSG